MTIQFYRWVIEVREIGGYFGLEQFIDNEYYKNLIALNTARNALIYLMMAKNIKKLYIPYYLGSSISEVLKKYHYDFEYYYIDTGFCPRLKKNLNKAEYIYIVNYYGQLTNEKIISLKKRYKNIIIDNTQSFFQNPIDGIDTIYSCRKFFGVPDGAYLSTSATLNEDLQTDISKHRVAHLLGRFEGIASDYYNTFKKNETSFRNEPLKRMSNLTKNILGAIDYKGVKKVRSKNYVYLHKKLRNINKLKLIIPEGPFSYPLYRENGLEIREMLIEKKIYIPILWPNVLKDVPKSSLEYQYTSNILPLPCDQRYGINDMQYIIEEVNNIV